MGSFLSLHGERIRNAECEEHSQHGARKRQRIVLDRGNNNPRLIPSLPDEISFQIPARLPRIYYLDVKLVSRSWKAAITSGELFQLRKELRTTEEWLYVLKKVGDGGHFWHALGGLIPLHSAEVFDPSSGIWTPVPSMTFSKANVVPAALFADIIKPIATGVTSYRGQLCVPQSLYTWPFFVDVGGEIYDPKTNSWSEMPAGMGEGWPARQAGTKLSAVVNGVLCALDPSSFPNSGAIKVYDPQEDAWKVAIAEVPVRVFANSESPYLLVDIHGKLHTIMNESGGDTTIFEADFPGNECCPSSCPSPVGSSTKRSDPSYSGEKEMWKIIASKNFGAADLVSCQVLNLKMALLESDKLYDA